MSSFLHTYLALLILSFKLMPLAMVIGSLTQIHRADR